MDEVKSLPNGSIHSSLQLQSIKPNGLSPRALEPYLYESKNWLIDYHYSRGDFEVCKLIVKEELEKTNGKSEFCNYVKGMILRQEGKIQESLDCFKNCFTLNPRSDETIKQMARSLYLLGRQRLAMEAFQEAMIGAKNPEWDVYHNLGVCLVNMGEHAKGKELLRQATQLNRHESSYLALAKVHVAEGDVQGAVAIYQTARDVYPDSVELAVSLAMLHMDLHDHQLAFTHFGTALALDPSCARALLAVGALMQGHGELDVAVAKYRVAAGHVPESASLWNNLGMCFLGKKRYVSAVSCLKRANALAPFDWKILLNLGLVHLATQQYASAFHYLSSAVNLDPASHAVFLPLAVTLVHLGDRNNARFAFEEAVAAPSSSAAVAVNFALFLLEEGDEVRATDLYRRFQTQAERMPGLEPEVMELASKLRVALKIAGRQDPVTAGLSGVQSSANGARSGVQSSAKGAPSGPQPSATEEIGRDIVVSEGKDVEEERLSDEV